MRILIVGTGTIGKPLIRFFLNTKDTLKIEEVIFHKNKAEERSVGMLQRFMNFGAKLAVYSEKFNDFRTLLRPLNLQPHYIFEEALQRADIVIDCTDKGIPRQLKEKYYKHLTSKLGFIAQGSETGFGKPYAFDINDSHLVPKVDRFIQVVSCNTHNGLRLLKSLAFDPDNKGVWNFENLIYTRMYLARRGADISQDEMPIGPVVGTPTDPRFGTHQGADIMRVLSSLGAPANLNIHTVADIFNQPYMHVVNFYVFLREHTTKEEVLSRFRHHHLAATTYEKVVNRAYSEGREFGHFGRIMNQTIICLPTIEVISDGHEVVGRCFTPQDGNALLSSVAATLWLKYPQTYRQIVTDNFYRLPFLFDII